MPTAARSLWRKPAFVSTASTTPICVSQISSGSCSTQPAVGKICWNSFCATALMVPSWSKTMARALVVPSSRARMYTRDLLSHCHLGAPFALLFLALLEDLLFLFHF